MCAEPRPLIVVVEDEEELSKLICQHLEEAGMNSQPYTRTAPALRFLQHNFANLVLLDVNLPDGNGFELLKQLKELDINTPAIFLTANTHDQDKVKGLNLGGDDYVTKPFSLDEIIARIKAILRRTIQEDEEAVLETGPIVLDQDTHEVRVAGSPIELSPTEFKLLRYLMQNANRVLSKAQILDHVWEYDFNGDAGIVESYISYLRRKLDPLTGESLIQTKRGFGYMLKTDAK